MYVLNRVKTNVFCIYSGRYFRLVTLMNEEKLGWGLKVEIRKGRKRDLKEKEKTKVPGSFLWDRS